MIPTHPLDVAFLPDGTVDLSRLSESIGRLGYRPVMEWMRARLSGDDPYCSVGPDVAPYGLFVSIWHSSKPGDFVHCCLDVSLRMLVQEARYGSAPAYLDGLVALVCAIRPAGAWGLIGEAVIHPKAVPHRREWLTMAAAYGAEFSGMLPYWLAILHNDPDHAYIAYTALAHDPELGLKYLPELYRIANPPARAVLIEEALRDIVERRAEKGTP
jgi:hypothetical protein